MNQGCLLAKLEPPRRHSHSSSPGTVSMRRVNACRAREIAVLFSSLQAEGISGKSKRHSVKQSLYQ